VALMNYVGREDADLAMRLQLTAGGFRDMTRIAASPFHIWQDILLSNKVAIKKSLKEFRECLTALELSVDDEAIREKFMKANEMRTRV